MSARDGNEQGERRAVVYCVVPAELAPKLHESLRRHFRDDPAVEVVVERRSRERRRAPDRRSSEAGEHEPERRGIRGRTGRRVAERRAQPVEVEPPPLPRRLQRHGHLLAFVKRVEPSRIELEDLDTARLVMRIQGGEHELFSELYMRYFDRVYGYMRTLMRDRHEAEDATQDVFARLYETLPSYERRSQPFRAWLFAVVRNQAVSHLRRVGRVTVLDSEEVTRRRDGEAEHVEELPSLDWISDRDLVMFVERLPLAQRQVLLLRYQLDLPFAQIGAILGRSGDDVRAIHSRALRFLSSRLRAVGRDPGHGGRIRARSQVREARVLRNRRFALFL